VREPCVCGRRPLTERELAIASLAALGLSTEAIAAKLYVSPHTVAAHLAKMLRNLKVRNRTEMVARLYVDGVLAGDSWPPRAVGLVTEARHRCAAPAVTPAELAKG